MRNARFLLIFFVGLVFVVGAVSYTVWLTLFPQLSEDPDRYVCDPAAPAGVWRCLYVSPTGDDQNSGTITSPFATLDRARMGARAFGEQWEGDLVILLRGGTYYLADTVVLGSKDSGKNGHSLIVQPYKDEVVTLAGGVPVGGWEGPFEDGVYSTTNIPKGVEFRHLVVNGRRAQRARHPNPPDFNAIAAWDKPTVIPTSECAKEPFGRRLGVRDEDAWFVDALDPAHLSRVEVFAERYGGSAILRIDSVGQADEGGSGIRYITPKSPERERLFGPNGNCSWQIDRLAFYFENSYAFLDEPGEWFLDTVSTPETPILYYKPRLNEDLATSTVIAPRLETLLKFSGTEKNRVHDIIVRGLHFTGTTWGLPGTEGLISLYPGSDYRDDTGYWDTYLHPAAVHLEGTEHITFERNMLHALGGMGVDLYDHTRDTIVDGNAILETGGVGIMVDGEGFVGTWRTSPEIFLPFPVAGEPRSSGDRITNNRIQRFGLDIWQSPGVAAAYPWDMSVEHNEISEGLGSGFWIGWYGPWARCHESDIIEGALPKLKQCQSAIGNNRVIGNRVFNVGGLLIDGGGIYTIGHQSPTDTFEDGMEIRGNHVFGMKRLTATVPTAFGALYLDGDTSFTRVIDNIFEAPQASATVEGAFGMFGEIVPIFLNPDEATSVPPHDIRWNGPGAQQPPGDNVANPALKPHVRDTAGLLPAYKNILNIERIR